MRRIVATRPRPVHPGEVLLHDFMEPLNLNSSQLAKLLRVSAPVINEIIRRRKAVTAEMALRLARYFGGDARSWLDLQTAHDLRRAEISSGKRIAREISPAGGATLPGVDLDNSAALLDRMEGRT